MKTEVVADRLMSLRRSEGPIQYVVLGGNSGDSLIDLGFFQLAENLDIDYKLVTLGGVQAGANVVISGGGGLVTEWGASGTRATVEVLQHKAANLVILPQTIRGNESLLRSLGPNVTIFTRESVSYEHALANARNGATTLLDHDMAFNLDAPTFLRAQQPHVPKLRNFKDVVRFGLYGAAHVRSRCCSEIEVRRRDIESRSTKTRWRAYNDLSFVATFRGTDKATIENTGRLLLSLINQYERVQTDRLHVGIGAYLLGKQVALVDNSNSKIRGVYELSMRSSNRVEFLEGK